MKALCIQSIELPLPGGGFKQFRAGVIYDVQDLDEGTIKAHFEHPVVSPPKGVQFRNGKSGAEEVR
jgi:hypothetical protein